MSNERPDFEEMLRAVARELSDAADKVARFDPEGVARTFGLDPDSVRRFVDEAGDWLRAQAGGGATGAATGPAAEPRAATPPAPGATPPHAPGATPPHAPGGTSQADDALRGAVPHPLDLPTDEQGLALAALDSGRWTVEPGTETLAARGEGPGPSDALGLLRELHVRDWVGQDGRVTATGRRALARWLESSAPTG